MTGRIKKQQAALLLGLTERALVDFARKGKIPGAAPIGRDWTFDPDKLHSFVIHKEAEACLRSEKPLPDATGEMKSCGAVQRLPVSSGDGRCTQTIRSLQKRAAMLARSA
jgi:hypothetical protein